MIRSKGLKRTRLKRVGKRALRDKAELEAFRANPPARCERCGERKHVDPHHRLPRSRGGTHTPENRAWLCSGPQGCHQLTHDHLTPDWKAWIK